MHLRKPILFSHFPHKGTSSPQRLRFLSEKAALRTLLGRYLQGRFKEMALVTG